MNPLTYLTCEHCDQEFPFTDQDRERAPYIVDMHLRLHVEICEAVGQEYAEGLAQIEAHLSRRCPYIRLGGPGVKWRCVRYGCTGEHQMERES